MAFAKLAFSTRVPRISNPYMVRMVGKVIRSAARFCR
jgi:hypothetical protein